jgi:prevent-host-death family protein
MRVVTTATEIKNNFGRYLRQAALHGEVIIERNGRPVAKLVALPAEAPAQEQAEKTFACDRLLGALRTAGEPDYKVLRAEALEKKYGHID